MSATATVTAATPKGRRRRAWPVLSGGENALDAPGLLLLLPCVVLLLILFVGPVGYAFYLGLTNIRSLAPTALNFHFNGLANISAAEQ